MPEYAGVEATSTLVTHAAVLSGPDLVLLDRAAVLMAGGRIVSVSGGDATDVPDGAEVVDARGLLLVPGFVDAHVHIAFADPAEVLRRGVTTVRDLGWPEEEIFALARSSRVPDFDGPLILAVGPIVTAPGGYPTRAAWAPPGTGRAVTTRTEAEETVGHLETAGAVAVKVALNPPVGPVLPRDTLQALVEAAHRRGLLVTGHVHGADELDKALDCGVDELAHMLMSPEEIPDATIRRMVADGMVVVPTLSIFAGRDREIAISNVARFRRAGGRVVYGTDLGNEGPRPGIDPGEIGSLAEAGFSSLEIVASATTEAAHHLALHSKGSLSPGKDADIVAVPVEALQQPEKLCDVRMVWREGRRAA